MVCGVMVCRMRLPNRYGCYAGWPPWTRADLILRSRVSASEAFDTEAEAEAEAAKLRDSDCLFDDGEWESFPPWDSCEMENFDTDDEHRIETMTVKTFEAARVSDEEHLADARRKHADDLAKSKKAAASAAQRSGRCHYSENAGCMADAAVDIRCELELSEPALLILKKEAEDANDDDKTDGKSTKAAAVAAAAMATGSLPTPEEATSLKSLRFVFPPGERASSGDERDSDSDIFLKLIAGCTSLQELHITAGGVGGMPLWRLHLGSACRPKTIKVVWWE